MERTALNRQRKRALHLFAGTHAARTDDALGRLEREVGIRSVFWQGLFEMVFAFVTVPDFSQSDHSRHVLELAIPVCTARQAVERMIRNVKLHHAFAKLLQLRRRRTDLHPWLGQSGAGGGRSAPALDLHKAETAGAEGFLAVGGTKLRYADAGHNGRAHERCPRRDRYRSAVDLERDQSVGDARGGAVVDFLN